MANVLSQAEIDELLSAMAAGNNEISDNATGNEESEVKQYDFRTANKFSKDQMRTLNFIYDNYASRLSTLLSATMRVICEVEVISVEEQTFSEFSNSMPSPVVLSIIKMAPLQGSVLLEIMPTIAFEIINRLLGGTRQLKNTDKAFTEIELSVLECMLRKMIAPMNDAWDKINKVNASLERIETSAQYAQIASANEPIAIITMNVRIGEVSDIFNICIPHVAVQPIAKQLVIKTWYSEQKLSEKTIEEKKMVSVNLSSIKLNLHAVFDDTNATVREILSTQVGDVIRIDHNINKKITIKVEHIPKFKGFIGIQGSNYAVQTTDII